MFFTRFAELTREISQRLAMIRHDIAAAAARAGRDPATISLVAVTKTHPPELLQAAVAAGVTAIGENYLQEAEAKFSALGWLSADAGAPVARHFIGHLQANKVRKALCWFEMIETVDSLALARRIDAIAADMGRRVPVLLQINVSVEEKKSGFFSNSVAGTLTELAKLAHIQVKGLMTIGRFTPDPEAARGDFIALRTLRDHLRTIAPPAIGLDELSMGMSHDFHVAIEEGATIVRVGSRLFGPRAVSS